MVKSNLKTAWRYLRKDRYFTFLNLIGLSTGMACVLLIYLWVRDEKNVDKFHRNDKQLYQVMLNIPLINGIQTQENTPGMLAQSLKREIPGIAYAASVQGGNTSVLTVGDKHVKARPQFVTEEFFHVFSFHLVDGNADKVLKNNNAVLLSDRLALETFGTTLNVIGKTIQWGDEKDLYTVTGIFNNPPATSTLQFDLLFNYQLLIDRDPEVKEWANSNPSTYLVLNKNVSVKEMNHKIEKFIKTKFSNSTVSLFLRKYSDKYLFGNYADGVQSGGRIEYVNLFTLIAIFILLIACINFMNLSTARASGRFKEIAIKKVAGARRSELIFQYLIESTVLSFFALFLSILLVVVALPKFNEITAKELTLKPDADLIVMFLIVGLITGLLAGSYPAFYLSRFNPVAILKGKLKTPFGELLIRKSLVIVQFTLSAVFIIMVSIVYQQMQLIQTIQLGYNKDHIIIFQKEGHLVESYDAFIGEVKNDPSVLKAATSGGGILGGSNGMTEKVDWKGNISHRQIMFPILDFDYDFIETIGIKLKAGRSFSTSFNDSAKLILNNAAVLAMGLKDPLGTTVTFWGVTYQIIGVTEDFHLQSLYEKVKPCLMRCLRNNNQIFVKLQAGKEKETLARLASVYRKFNEGIPFEFTFLDDAYQSMYVAEKRLSAISTFFASLAIIICCLGLLGLAAFTAQRRKKEIGIRKVIGATVTSVTRLLLADFLTLVLIAVVIAFPLAAWVGTMWLEKFAYRIHLGVGVFILTTIFIVTFSLLTISFQAIKAAMANPVESLRLD